MSNWFRPGSRVLVTGLLVVAATGLGCNGGNGGKSNVSVVEGGSGGADPFVLSWQDDFDTLDPSAWQLQTFTFGGNLAQFSTENASVANGVLTMKLTPN